MSNSRTALVIGGGIAGPATGMALQKAGFEPVVYEAHAASAEGVGSFLTLASNGIDALRTIGADKPVLDTAFPTPHITLRSTTGKQLGKTSTGGVLPDGTTSQTIRRSDLYRVIQAEAARRGIPMEFGKRLVKAEQVDDGVRAWFADGTEAVASMLIGADGVHSTVRRLIDPAAPEPTYAGLINTGGYASGVPVEIEPGSYEMIFGRRAFFGYAAAPDGTVWWFANLPRRAQPEREELRAIDPATWRSKLLQLFADDAGPAVALIEATPELMTPTPIHAMPRLPKWRTSRMIVIGDAAHAPTPTSGQGASLAVEDAVALAKCLRDLPTAPAAFARFEAARRPRVERIIRWAARINNNKAAGRAARVLRDAMLPAILRLTADNKALRETFGYHIEWDSEMSPDVAARL